MEARTKRKKDIHKRILTVDSKTEGKEEKFFSAFFSKKQRSRVHHSYSTGARRRKKRQNLGGRARSPHAPGFPALTLVDHVELVNQLVGGVHTLRDGRQIRHQHHIVVLLHSQWWWWGGGQRKSPITGRKKKKKKKRQTTNRQTLTSSSWNCSDSMRGSLLQRLEISRRVAWSTGSFPFFTSTRYSRMTVART